MDLLRPTNPVSLPESDSKPFRFRVERFECAPAELMLRLHLRLPVQVSHSTPATLFIARDATEQAYLPLVACTGRTPLTDALRMNDAGDWLWRAAFAVPPELACDPSAAFALRLHGQSLLSLPAPNERRLDRGPGNAPDLESQLRRPYSLRRAAVMLVLACQLSFAPAVAPAIAGAAESQGVTSGPEPTPEAPSAPPVQAPSEPSPEAPSSPPAETPVESAPETPAAPPTETPGQPAPEKPSSPPAEAPGQPAPEKPSSPPVQTPGAPTAEVPASPADTPAAQPAPTAPAAPTIVVPSKRPVLARPHRRALPHSDASPRHGRGDRARRHAVASLPTVHVEAPTPPTAGTPALMPEAALLELSAGYAWSSPANPEGEYQGPPAYLIPIYKKAGKRYDVPWRILAAINAVETNYGRDLRVSSSGALGWMQFMPATWKEWAVAADRRESPSPYSPQDAIFTAARYLKASGAATDLLGAIFSYNHAEWYVAEVLGRAQQIDEHEAALAATAQAAKSAHAAKAAPKIPSTEKALIAAMHEIGTPYVWGGELERKAFDCSGLVQWSFAKAGIELPRTAQEQYNATTRIAADEAEPGDLVFFGGSAGDVSHVGIVVGPGLMLDATHTGAYVEYSNFIPAIGAPWGSDLVVGFGHPGPAEAAPSTASPEATPSS